MNELTGKIAINAQENRLTDAERTEMEEKHMLQLSMRANMLPASKSTRDVYLLMKALSSGVEFANIKLSGSFRHEMDISANNWWFRLQAHPDLAVSDHFGWSHFGWNWELTIGYPPPHFPYKTALIHTTSFKSSKEKKKQYLHKTLHPKDYDGYDYDHGDHLVRNFRWNSVTDAVQTEVGRKEFPQTLLENQLWWKYENGGDPQSFGTELGKRIMTHPHLEHDLILCFWRTKDPVVRTPK
jgi:hypothetical protein